MVFVHGGDKSGYYVKNMFFGNTLFFDMFVVWLSGL